MEKVRDVGPSGFDDGGDTSSVVIRFSPGQVATGHVPLFEPGPGRVWSTYPHLLKALGYLLLFTSFVTLYMAAAGWEYFFYRNWDRDLMMVTFNNYFAAVKYSGCTVMCFMGSRALIVRGDPEMGLVAGLSLLGTLLSPSNLWDTGIMDMPGGACGAYYLILVLTIIFLILLHVVRRRRARVASAPWNPSVDDGYGRRG